jgi:hypothetical protein
MAVLRINPPPHAVRGRGTMRSMVEGASGGGASGEAHAPSTAKTRSPFPAARGRMKQRCCRD